MYNSNGPPRGSNVIQDQSSYDLIFKDIIVNSNLGTHNTVTNSFSYNLGTDSINQIYKVEITAATVNFNTAIPTNVKNQTLIISIPQLNGNTTRVAGNTFSVNQTINQVYNPTTNSYDPVVVNNGNTSQGSNIVQGQIFTQIPDNCTPLGINGASISLFVGPHMYESVQFYNPPINKLNLIDILFFDTQSNQVLVGSTSGTINTFYLNLRIHYFQKRYNTTSFSTSVFNNVGSGTMDSIFR